MSSPEISIRIRRAIVDGATVRASDIRERDLAAALAATLAEAIRDRVTPGTCAGGASPLVGALADAVLEHPILVGRLPESGREETC